METDYDQLDKEQRLKAAMYYSIKQIAKEVEEEMDVSFSAQVLATLSESVSRQAEHYAVDLELFAKHARRTNVGVDDVRLLARTSETLLQHLNSVVEERVTPKDASKKEKKTKSKKSNADQNEDN